MFHRPEKLAAGPPQPAPGKRKAALAAIALMFAAPVLAGPSPTISAASIRLNPVPGRPSAGYLTLTGGAKADRLTGATIPDARVELHSMTMAGGIMKMAPLKGVDVPAGGVVRFATGGNHLMIFGLKGAPKSLPVTLHFASGMTASTVVIVTPVGTQDDHAGHSAR